MKSWLRDLLDALLLRGATLARVADRPDAFGRGLTVLLAVALFVGLPALVGDVIAGFQPPAIIEPSEVQPNPSASIGLIRPWLRSAGVPEPVIDQLLQVAQGNAAMAGTIALQIDRLPTALPRPMARAFIGLGHWLSRPFANSPFPLAVAALSTWLGYGIWVMLVAKLLGGRATLHGFFGATAFFAAPHVLNIFAGIPVAGGILGAIAFVWGLIIYSIATGVSHRLPAGRALVAVFAPIVLLLTLIALVLATIMLWFFIAGLSGTR
ncbi:MAG: hypothetical protein ACM30E_03455 [Nitrososphaerales archaeon]